MRGLAYDLIPQNPISSLRPIGIYSAATTLAPFVFILVAKFIKQPLCVHVALQLR